jgi:hypothetical protein
MVEMRPNGRGTCGPRCIGPIGAGRRGVAQVRNIPPKPGNAGEERDLSSRQTQDAVRTQKWVTHQIRRVFRNCGRCYMGKRRREMLLDGGVLDHFWPRLTKSYEPSDPAAADRVIGSCSFMLGGHGDLCIEWQEKDHDEIVNLLQAKMNAGARFFVLDPASLGWVPIRRAHRAMGRKVYVLDPHIKKLIEGGFGRFPTTHFEGISPLKILGIAESAEEAASAVTIAAAPPMPEGEADSLIGAAAIAVFLDRDLGVRPKDGKRFTRRTVYNWAAQGKLPVGKLPNSNGLVASKSALRQWFDEMGRRTDVTVR